ncbi:MAG: hypothetical protein HYY30_11245 [Chloroflexi bacterium]|nr:hypothetical protein [Chloroflexota bacterium]
MEMRVLDHALLQTLNESSVRSGRSQNLRPDRLASKQQDRYYINEHKLRERDGQQEVRACIVLDLFAGQTAWLDISCEEFAAIPEVDISEDEWETAMCAGTPPQVP